MNLWDESSSEGRENMGRKGISEAVQRKLYAESMGRCMNPECRCELFSGNGDISEKAHIDAYCKTADNSYENLVILCPNCHTKFDKNGEYAPDEVKEWKIIRQREVESLFRKKYDTFDSLKTQVVPLLEENKSLYEQYYVGDCKRLWDKFEVVLLKNNRMLSTIFKENMQLFQSHSNKKYSNRKIINDFLVHVEEFEATRMDSEKVRKVLFPKEIQSMFGLEPIDDSIMPSTESLELLMQKLDEQELLVGLNIGTEAPYLLILEDGDHKKVYLNDTPQIRQLYYNYHCFKSVSVRLDSLNFALSYIRKKNVVFSFTDRFNLRQIEISGKTMIFVYEYCLSKVSLRELAPNEGSVVVNLHNWNGESCISDEAYQLAKEENVTLLTMNGFYGYINRIRNK